MKFIRSYISVRSELGPSLPDHNHNKYKNKKIVKGGLFFLIIGHLFKTGKTKRKPGLHVRFALLLVKKKKKSLKRVLYLIRDLKNLISTSVINQMQS